MGSNGQAVVSFGFPCCRLKNSLIDPAVPTQAGSVKSALYPGFCSTEQKHNPSIFRCYLGKTNPFLELPARDEDICLKVFKGGKGVLKNAVGHQYRLAPKRGRQSKAVRFGSPIEIAFGCKGIIKILFPAKLPDLSPNRQSAASLPSEMEQILNRLRALFREKAP